MVRLVDLLVNKGSHGALHELELEWELMHDRHVKSALGEIIE